MDINKITLPNGLTYDLKDSVARAALGGTIMIRGVTTTQLTDEATTNPIIIDGDSYTAVMNDAVFYGKKEFVFDGAKWHEFGDMSGLGDMAMTDTASANYTPAGSVALTGSVATVSPAGSGTVTYTPGGNVTLGTKAKLAVSKANTGATTFTPEGSVSLTDGAASTVSAAGSGTATYTPSGTIAVNASSGSGTAYTPEGSISVNAASGSGTSYTPEGSVAAPTISLATAGSTTSVTPFGSAGTLPSLTMTVTDGNLTIGFSQGTLPSAGTAVTVKTGDGVYSASAPAFTGTEKKLAFSGTQKKLAFSGTGARLVTDNNIPTSASFNGTAVRLETSEDVPTAASFSGTGVRLKVDTNVPTGATFTGTAVTITVTPDVSGGTISFTIADAPYTADSGMTWGQWVGSAYNTAGYEIGLLSGHIETANAKYSVAYQYANYVSSSETIQNGTAYVHSS